LKKIIFLTVALIYSVIAICSKSQNEDIDILFQRFARLYGDGDLVKAEETLLSILNSKETLNEPHLVAAFNNLGVVNMMLAKYDRAIGFYNQAETLVTGKKENLKDLADIYTNKGLIYSAKRSFDLAIRYYEKSIRIYYSLNTGDRNILSSLSSAFLNIGIALLNTKEYITALDYFNKSSEIKLSHNIPGLALVYLNLAKTWAKLNNPVQAEEFFVKSIDSFSREFGGNYFRLAEVYLDYGLYLYSEGRNPEALEAHRKALSICLRNYGEKHTLVALSYKNLGDHYFNQPDYITALEYYQKSLMSVVIDFSDPDIFSNPSIDSSFLDIRLLDNLKSKARALECYAMEQSDPVYKLKIINKSLETVELALQLVDRIRNNYPTEESRIYLSENEKETYLFAVHIAGSLYSLTHGSSLVEKMYTIAQKAKGAVLRNEITENELFYSTGIPDSTREIRNRLEGNIGAYNNLIINEYRKVHPDSNKISLWKDAIFDMNRDMEKMTTEINMKYPQYNNLLQKTEPVPLTRIQQNLHRDETIVEYLLSNQYKNGGRKLYIFLITKNNIEFHESSVDSVFLKKAEIIRNTDQKAINNNYRDYTGALNYMYVELVEPVEKLFAGNKLKIIPDEEIGWLPFDAFLMSNPGPQQTDYEGLQYLINNYTISYGYTSSLSDITNRIKIRKEVIAFLPDYIENTLSIATIDNLKGAEQEIGSIYRWFKGKKFTGSQATETNFMKVIRNPFVFHLAMHSISDTLNSKYSYLLFDTRSDTIEDGKLYNYEISLARIISPMVVLSSCNSGTGTLYHGEGLMSLARGFILAGASSVVRTAWEVNDETSAKIISRFYYYLSKGKHKDEAIRLAKLDYLKDSSPAFTSPYFWAAYEVLGDSAPVAVNYRTLSLIIGIAVMITFLIMYPYFRRRRILSDLSR
jgi:CHAT domain-containing protein